MKLCVIGAGAAGLCAAKNGVEFGCHVTVFEQAECVGGTWVYTDEVGRDRNGLNVHSSMYQGLHTNLPKEIMGYPHFPIQHQEKSYISAFDFLDYLKSYASTFDLLKLIKFKHHVMNVSPSIDDKWSVNVRNLASGDCESCYFDAVLICNGHYNTPIVPGFEGQDVFQGKQLHSHDYRKSDAFKGERVLVIGAGPSGMDLTNEISKVAEAVTLSHHLKEPPKTLFKPNVNQKPDVMRLTRNGAQFVDGSTQDFSVVFYCTGYKYSFPFLSADCGIKWDNNYVRPLFKQCLSINRPSLGFIGLPFYVCATQMFDLQARFTLTFMTGRKRLLPRDQMLDDYKAEMNERWSKGLGRHQAHLMGPEQNKYYNDLAATAGVEPIPSVMTKLHNFASLRFVDDLISFRSENFRILDNETFVKVSHSSKSIVDV